MHSQQMQAHHRATAVLCGGCQSVFGGQLVTEINARAGRGLLERIVDGGLGALNPLSCPSCGWRYAGSAPVLVRGLGAGATLIIPANARHELRAAQAWALGQLTPAPGSLGEVEPALYVIADDAADLATRLLGEPTLATEHLVLDDATQARAPAPRGPALAPYAPPLQAPDEAKPRPPSDAPTVELPIAAAEQPPVASLASMDRAVEDAFDAIGAVRPPSTPSVQPTPIVDAQTPEPTSDAKADHLLSELLSARPSAVASHAPPPQPGGDDSPTDAWEAIGEGWSLDVAPPKGDDDPTHVVSLADIERARPSGPAFETVDGEYTWLDFGEDDRLIAAALIGDEEAVFFNAAAELRFQLHTPSQGPICGLLIVGRDDDGEVNAHVFWPIDDQSEHGVRILDKLSAGFAADVRLYVDPSAPAYRRHHARPLEPNVRLARAELDAQVQPRAAAIAAVVADEHDRVGRLRHNFQADTFETLSNASEARLAIGILGYWSAPERRDYLLRIKSFPAGWFEAITRRVLEGAVHFGLAMDPPMRQRAFDLKLAANSASLLRRLLANFAEVNLNLRPCELDTFDIWDNWEALLAHAEELDLRVDEEIEELAARAMDRARRAAQAPEPVEIHLADDSIELEEVLELEELTDERLLACLARSEQRLDATLLLLQRPGSVHVPAIFDALRAMPREELLTAVPAALAKGPAFESHVLGGLQARRTSLRLASALFLSEIRSERALVPLLALLPSADEPEWPVISRAAARMGRRIIGPALDLVESEGDANNRVAHTLALLGGDARGALAAARDQRTDAGAQACLTEAIGLVNSVSFGDAADFGERLADAFSVAGPDRVSPDFSEVLESIDVGPGASLSGVAADHDLDD
ncbi:MAG: hypothetical protein ACI9U2_004179 [Bradymonadia bacterium]|jgi:hypothetical protein